MIVASFYAPRFEKWKDVNYDDLLQLLDKSCKKLNLNHIVISDAARPNLETFITDLPENLMQAFFVGQMNLMRKAREPILFVGADCLITRKIMDFGAADLAITLSSTFSDCIMNTGMVWVNDREKCFEVWKQALDKEPKNWGDDQVFLYRSILDNEPELNVEKLSCEEYNWAPNDVRDDAGMPVVVHFRGRRKRFMKDWAKSYLNID